MATQEINSSTAGIVSIVAGMFSLVGIVGPLFGVITVPIGIISGIIALRHHQKRLGQIGLILNMLAVVIFLLIVWWGSHAPNN